MPVINPFASHPKLTISVRGVKQRMTSCQHGARRDVQAVAVPLLHNLQQKLRVLMSSTTALAVLSATCAILLVLLLLGSPREAETAPLKPRAAGPASDLSPLTAELAQLKNLLAEQQAAASEYRALAAQLAAGKASMSGAAAGEAAAGDAAGGAAAAAASAVTAAPLADSVELERAALAACTPSDVPILGMMRSPCPPGMHGYDCKVRWAMGDHFVP